MQVMDQESFFSEKSSFANKNFKKYGTTTNYNQRRNQQSSDEILIRHDLIKSDTLQGIALKYGCSMEQIRRANRLFTNDSLFLRQFLMVPVSSDSPYCTADNTSEIRSQHMLSKRANTIAGTSSKEPLSPNDSIDSITSSVADDDEHRKFMDEFLEKIDSSIASSKKIVKEHQRNSDYISSSQSDDSLFSSTGGNSFVNHNYDPSGSGTSYQQMYQSMSHQSARYSLGGVSSDTTQLVVRSNGRQVRNSLQKLQKQQDEIFEL